MSRFIENPQVRWMLNITAATLTVLGIFSWQRYDTESRKPNLIAHQSVEGGKNYSLYASCALHDFPMIPYAPPNRLTQAAIDGRTFLAETNQQVATQLYRSADSSRILERLGVYEVAATFGDEVTLRGELFCLPRLGS